MWKRLTGLICTSIIVAALSSAALAATASADCTQNDNSSPCRWNFYPNNGSTPVLLMQSGGDLDLSLLNPSTTASYLGCYAPPNGSYTCDNAVAIGNGQRKDLVTNIDSGTWLKVLAGGTITNVTNTIYFPYPS